MSNDNNRTAVVKRINRKLAKNYEKLCKCRENSRRWYNLGDLYVLDTYRDVVIDTHVEVEKLAAILGVMSIPLSGGNNAPQE